MTDSELLAKVKIALNITGTYQDNTLLEYIAETKNYLEDAGVSAELIASDISVGVITRGVSDLWNYGMGSVTFSEYFYQRAIQLRYKNLPEHEPVLGDLQVTSTKGAEIGTTHIKVTGQSDGAIFKITMSARNIDPIEYDEDLSDWQYWDGVSDIAAENGHYIFVAEVDKENKAKKLGSSKIVVRLW